jgi:hypothetical protein
MTAPPTISFAAIEKLKDNKGGESRDSGFQIKDIASGIRNRKSGI